MEYTYSTWRKTSWSKEENQQQTQPTFSGQKNILRKLLCIPSCRLKAGFFKVIKVHFTMRYSSRKLSHENVITTACNFWSQIACLLRVEAFCYQAKKYLKSATFSNLASSGMLIMFFCPETHIWRWCPDLNPSHIGFRWVRSPLCYSSPWR